VLPGDPREDGAVSDVYLMLYSAGEVQAVDLGPMMRRHRAAYVEARADVIDPAAALFADPAFDLEETYDVAEAALPGADVNAASYIGLVLREVELNGGGGGD
jgi:hypothetical protein